MDNSLSNDALEWLYAVDDSQNSSTYHTHRLRRHKPVNNPQNRESATELTEKIEDGIVGCFGRITVDGFDVSKTEQGLRLYNAAIGCDASSMGPCLSVPCQNGGQCVPNRTESTYR